MGKDKPAATKKGKNDGKGKDAKEDGKKGKDEKVKSGNSINVRHILCEKQSKVLEAMAKLKEVKSTRCAAICCANYYSSSPIIL